MAFSVIPSVGPLEPENKVTLPQFFHSSVLIVTSLLIIGCDAGFETANDRPETPVDSSVIDVEPPQVVQPLISLKDCASRTLEVRVNHANSTRESLLAIFTAMNTENVISTGSASDSEMGLILSFPAEAEEATLTEPWLQVQHQLSSLGDVSGITCATEAVLPAANAETGSSPVITGSTPDPKQGVPDPTPSPEPSSAPLPESAGKRKSED